ncbi:hypothetical protein GKODMF_01845 [Candidatus Electrothrix gigas]
MIEIVNRCIITALLLLIGTNAWGVNLSGYFGNSYAVVIGIHKYQDRNTWSDVTYGVEDANDMVAFFLRQGFRRSNVKSFINDQATKDSIISYLADDLARTLRSNDRVVFYFSGHGYTEQIGIKDFGYIIPYDGKQKRTSTFISMEKLQELAAKLGNARHQLFILDSCFGGMIEPKGPGISSKTPFYLENLANRRVRLYMTAGGANEKAPMRSSFSKNSHYTANLLRGLNGLADKNYDGIVTTSELEGYLLTSASIRGVIMPRWGTLDGHENGEFVFSSPKTARIKHGSNRASSGGDKGYKSQLASGGSIEYSKNEFDALRGGSGQAVNKSQQSLRISPSCSSKHIKKGDSFVFQVERLSNGKLHLLSRHQVDIKTTGEWKPLRNGSYPYFRLEGKGNTTLQITDKTTGGSTKCSVFFEE